MATPLSVFRKAKNVIFFSEKRMDLDPQTHIYLESVLPGKSYKHIYMATSLSVKKPKKGILPEKRVELNPQTHIYIYIYIQNQCHKGNVISIFI